MEKKGEIIFTKYGPYTVVDAPIYNENGEVIKTPRVYSLCRCGESKSKPFCDGAHGKIGFVADKGNEKSGKTKIYSGEKIKIYDNRQICSHTGACHLENVFDSEKRPWINPDGTPDVDKIISIIKLCPSGALTYEKDGEHITAWFDEQKIIVMKDGPFYVQGSVELKDDQNSEELLVSKEHYTLCRCGESKNKPFCDGAHVEANFKG